MRLMMVDIDLMFLADNDGRRASTLVIWVGGELTRYHFYALWAHLVLTNNHIWQLQLNHLN